jgi:hypothetical protein
MKNYKTTIAALAGYIAILINRYTQLDLPEDVIIGAVICTVALLSKDYDTTGIGIKARKE